jgi:hypothetical protein
METNNLRQAFSVAVQFFLRSEQLTDLTAFNTLLVSSIHLPQTVVQEVLNEHKTSWEALNQHNIEAMKRSTSELLSNVISRPQNDKGNLCISIITVFASSIHVLTHIR